MNQHTKITADAEYSDAGIGPKRRWSRRHGGIGDSPHQAYRGPAVDQSYAAIGQQGAQVLGGVPVVSDAARAGARKNTNPAHDTFLSMAICAGLARAYFRHRF